MKAKTLGLMTLCILSLVLVMGFMSAVTYTETFDNSEATTTYADSSFVGDNSITWNYVDARNEYSPHEIDGAGLVFQDLDGKIYSNTISGGIADFSVKLSNGNADTDDRQVELFINSVSKGQSTIFSDDTTHTFTISDINIEGDVIIEIRNILDSHIIIDDITWTDYAPFNFCEYDDGVGENPGELDVDIKDITVTSGFGDDNEWLLLDEIEIEVEIENKGDYDVDDISIEWGLYNVEDNKWAFEIDEVDEFNLKDGDEEKLIITFRVDDDDLDLDLDELGDSYTLFVRATGEVDEGDNPKTCASASEEITIEIEDDFVILNSFQIENTPLEAMTYSTAVLCGNTVHVAADIWNIGEDDQEEISVVVNNNALGINEVLEIGDIDAFDSETISFEFQVPEGMEEKTYTLKFTIYDEDHDIYENDYDDEKAIFDVYLKVEGNCILAQAFVSAVIDEGGKAGKELIVRSTIENTGQETTTYLINAVGYTEWASSAIVEPDTLVLEAGQSVDVLITLKVNKDISGERLFNIEVVSEGELVVSQPLSVSIEKALFGDLFNEDNGLITALIIGIALILVIIIIVLAIRVARR